MKNVMKDVNILEQARQVLGLPCIKDKVICYISSWERTKITNMPAEDDEKDYAFDEMGLFEMAKTWLLADGDFSFVAFREFENIDDDEIDYEAIEKAKNEFPVPPPKNKEELLRMSITKS